jgi:P-type Cu+ transporter
MPAPVSASSSCPACGKALDPLRAGQVAILDGGFRYFCDAGCKNAFIESASKRASLDALTCEPPMVAPASIPEESGAKAKVDPPAALEEPSEVVSGVREQTPEPEADEPAPATMRSRASSPDVPTARRSYAESAPMIGVFSGVLASVVSLAGETGALLRLPLALVAAGIFIARKAWAPNEPSEPSVALSYVPLALGSLAAIVSTFTRDPHADAHASFVGLGAASALVVDLLVMRSRKDFARARTRVRNVLAASARVVRGDAWHVAAADEVKPGEQVVVEAGETIAVDGIVAAGEAQVVPWLDSPAIGRRAEGDAVVAGAVVASGTLRVTATFSGAERAWLRLAGEHGASRIEATAPLVAYGRRAIERGAPVVAIVVGAAIYASNGSWLDVIVAAASGGFGLAAIAALGAAATAHARGHAVAQRRGIVYKDAIAFDAAARADVAVVCSRGTILLGEPEIVAIEAISKDGLHGISERNLKGAIDEETKRVLAIAAGAELSSTHPFASAILHEARARNIRPDNVRSALGHSGLGVTALAPNGDRVIVGSRAFLLQEKVSVAIADKRTSALEAQGRSVLLVAVGGRLVGLIALQDGLRPGARAAIKRMHDARIEPVLLSGEARETCETIARALDIEHVRPEVLPADRGAEVRALADGGRVVAALGHASTDDGALGASDLAVAMGAAGAAPGEWGVALASDDVRDAALSLTIPRSARERARVALVVGGIAQAAGTMALAFGLAPPVVLPVFGVLAAAAVFGVIRDREMRESRDGD